MQVYAVQEALFEPEFIMVDVVLGERGGQRTDGGSVQIFSDGTSRLYPASDLADSYNGPKLTKEQYLEILNAGIALNQYLLVNYNSEQSTKMNGTLHFDFHGAFGHISAITCLACEPADTLIKAVNKHLPQNELLLLTHE